MKEAKSLDALPAQLLEEIGHFFRSCNDIKGKRSKALARSDPQRARELVEQGRKRLRKGGERLPFPAMGKKNPGPPGGAETYPTR